jgi:hypothetical protein
MQLKHVSAALPPSRMDLNLLVLFDTVYRLRFLRR